MMMSSGSKTDRQRAVVALFEQFANVGKAMSSPGRLLLLELLAQGEKSVETLANLTGLQVKNTSAQLKVLRGAHLVESRRDGQRILYRLASEEVGAFWLALRALAMKQFAEARDIVERHFGDPDGLDPIRRESLIARVRRGEVVLIDVRPEDEYAAAHIPGARSVPLADFTQRMPRLPKNKEIVAYCRGPYCDLAIEAVATLRQRGYRATLFEDGVPEWRDAGLPVEQGIVPEGARSRPQRSSRKKRS
jgi:rhodanese-related sulfurtransferase